MLVIMRTMARKLGLLPANATGVRRPVFLTIAAALAVGLCAYAIVSVSTRKPGVATLTGLPLPTVELPATPGPDDRISDMPSDDPGPTIGPTSTTAGSGAGRQANHGGVPEPGAAPAPGTGLWSYATISASLGSSGPVRSFRVAAEVGVPVGVDDFAATVDTVLGDRRSWIGTGEVQWRQVAGTEPANLTIYLASPWTAYALCRAGGVDNRIGGTPYTNCRVGANVVINSDRYQRGASAFTGSLAVYRGYAINHEVGHWLGRGHVLCPAAGLLAPVMQQQTLGMQGCLPNAWPYPGPDPTPPASDTPTQTPTPTPSPSEPEPTPSSTPDETPTSTTPTSAS
jgi:hypothetical protein